MPINKGIAGSQFSMMCSSMGPLYSIFGHVVQVLNYEKVLIIVSLDQSLDIAGYNHVIIRMGNGSITAEPFIYSLRILFYLKSGDGSYV